MLAGVANRVDLRHLTRRTTLRFQLEAAYTLKASVPQTAARKHSLASRAFGIHQHGQNTGAFHAPIAPSFLSPLCLQGAAMLPAQSSLPADTVRIAAVASTTLKWKQAAWKALLWKASFWNCLWIPLPKTNAWPVFRERMDLLFQQCQEYLQADEPVLCKRMIDVAQACGAELIAKEWDVVGGMSQYGKGDTVFALPDGSNVVMEVKHISTEHGITARRSRTQHRHKVREQALFYGAQWFYHHEKLVTVYAASYMNDRGLELENVFSRAPYSNQDMRL